MPAVLDQRILDPKEHQKKDSGSAVSGSDMTAAVSVQNRGEIPWVCFASVVSMTALTSVVKEMVSTDESAMPGSLGAAADRRCYWTCSVLLGFLAAAGVWRVPRLVILVDLEQTISEQAVRPRSIALRVSLSPVLQARAQEAQQ